MLSIAISSLLLAGAAASAYFAFRRRAVLGGVLADRRFAAAAVAAVALFVIALWATLRSASATPLAVPIPLAVATMPGASVMLAQSTAHGATPRAKGATQSDAASEDGFPPNRTIMRQHLDAIQHELERAHSQVHDERERSEDLLRRLDELEAQIKALSEEIDLQDQKTQQLHKRLRDKQPATPPP